MAYMTVDEQLVPFKGQCPLINFRSRVNSKKNVRKVAVRKTHNQS